QTYTYVSNSDAHSLAKIAREYQEIQMKEPSFKEFLWALHAVQGRKITRNFGMNPQLGKYYTTVCDTCLDPVPVNEKVCPNCGSKKIIKGVYDRIKELGRERSKINRPPYLHQVPLEYLPSLGPKTFTKLLQRFGTEMYIIHQAKQMEIEEI